MIRPDVCAFVFACIMAAPTLQAEGPLPAEELLKLEGQELVDAANKASVGFYADECPFTAEELIAVVEKLIGVEKSVVAPVREYFEQACSKAKEQQVDKLVKIYVRFGPGSFEKKAVLPVLASRLVSREAASIRAEKRKANLVEAAPVLPPELKAAPQELQEAWQVYQRATAPFENAFPKVESQIDAYANEKSFYNLIDAALQGSTGLEDEIRQFAWTGANCLSITDVEDAQDIAMLLMLLRERRLDEAIGAAMRVAGTEGSISSPEKVAGPIVELIETCGLDWEMIFAGGQAAKEVRGYWTGSQKNPCLAALANHGSARAGLLVNQLAHLAKPDKRAAYVGAFSAWIETAPKRQKCNGEDTEVGRSDREFLPRKAMSRAIQEASLHTIEEFSTEACPEELALFALNAFGRTQAASSIPALQALTRHRSSAVAGDATKVLCAMGVITAPEPARPVRFRILLNGKRISPGQRVDWNVSFPEDKVGGLTKTKADGVVELPRNHFVDTRRPVQEVELRAWGPAEAAAVEFSVTTTAPGNLDATTDVPVKLSSVEITLKNQDRLNAPAPEKVFLSLIPRHEERDTDKLPDAIDGTYEIWMGTLGVDVFRHGYEVSAKPSIHLPAVQDGTYDVLIGTAGAEVWHGMAEVGPGPSRIEAALKPGSDVRLEIMAPDGQPRFTAEIFKDGKRFQAVLDHHTHSYRALPCGRYEICIRGSEWLDEYRQSQNLKRGPDEVSYAGREIFFEIAEGSPAIIDLGEIRLEAIGQP